MLKWNLQAMIVLHQNLTDKKPTKSLIKKDFYSIFEIQKKPYLWQDSVIRYILSHFQSFAQSYFFY